MKEQWSAPAAAFAGREYGYCHIVDQKKDVITVPTETSAQAPTKTTRTAAESAEIDLSGATDAAGELDAVGALDFFMLDEALGSLRRLRPDTSLVRYAINLTRHPGTVAQRAGKLAADLVGVAAGTSTIAPQRRDRRFADPAWSANPLLKRTVQAYLAIGGTAEELLADAALDWRDNERLKFVLTNLIAASAPSNYPQLSPAVWKAFIDSGGMSAVRGARALVSDMSSAPRIPTMVEPDAFEIGKDLACTPGAVVARTEVFELIQYEPTTETVHRIPLLMIPPMINKYYITDLAPGRSMLEFFVAQGYQVFVVSWRNPEKRHSHWDLDTYGLAVTEALTAAREITKAPKVNLMGLCAGGITSSMVCAHLSATGQLDQINTLGLGVAVLDQTHAGTTVALMDEGTAAASTLASRARGYMDGRTLAEVFAWLRPDDLIWNYWVNNYLQGKTPPPFDILYWNADTTRMPAGLHRNFIEIAMGNALAKPGAASMLGTPVNLSKVNVNSYVMAGIDDHIVPWPSAYRSTQLLSGDVRFVLSTSGHVAAMVNPPTNPKATFRLAPSNPPDHRDWLAQAETVQGSWWPDYTTWLKDRSGDMKQRPRRLGSAKHPPLDPAPGSYVLQK